MYIFTWDPFLPPTDSLIDCVLLNHERLQQKIMTNKILDGSDQKFFL